jgi:hypothetical protein
MFESLMFAIGLATGVGIGLLGGVIAMASLRLSARADEEIDTMLESGGHETGRLPIVHDFTGGHRHRVF